MLQELYQKARIREAEEDRRREERRLALAELRKQLAALPPEAVAEAVAFGWEGLMQIIEYALGDGAWARAVNAVPDEWEEEDALEALSDALLRPNESEHAWLLLASSDRD